MSLKENNSQNTMRVKPEPLEHHIVPLGASTTWQTDRQLPANKTTIVKPEPVEPSAAPNIAQTASHAEDVQMHDAEVKEPPAEPVAPLYTTYTSVEAIDYTPENALKEGLGMVQAIKNNIRRLELGSKMRKDVWLREVTGLESQGAPTTLIAVCGATGAGKSSLLNAILDDNIVPTSGMRACTAVVTEIAYHDKPTINADVSFLTLDEWKEELAVLLEDLVDEDGNVKRATDLRSEAGVAWHKVHAVYPTINADQIARMTPDQIIARDPSIANRLGTTKLICSKDSKAFASEISKFIDSKDQKRSKKDKKTKEKKVVKMADRAKGKDKKKDNKAADDDGPALWPLIRQVIVKCNSAALSTGAILVDLPGVADANAARSNIAKDYMKKCQAIWVLAPITRAVDDRTAKDLLGDAFKIQLKMDGNYDDSAITFVATKADDISCSEVIRALKLEDDEEVEAIEDKISEIKDDQKKWKASKTTAEKAAKSTEKELKEIRAIAEEYRAHLKALENGESFTPKLTAKKKATSPSVESPNPKKRKRAGTGRKGSPKRQKSTDDGDTSQDDDEEEEDGDDDEDDEDEIESASDVDSDDDSSHSYAGSESGDDSDGSDVQEHDSEAEVDEEMDAEDEVTEESLKAKIAESGETIKALRERLSNERADKKKANDEMTNAKDRLAKAQTEKNGICSLKRSEFSREVLKDDFRAGLKEIDEADAQERDPDNFDPTQQLRNYDAIDLPTFCASARDYIRIKKQVKGDGKPTCFTDIKDTGIPELQEWCRNLTISSRQRAARSFLTHLRTFVSSVRNYVNGITEVREEDRKALRDQWESILEEELDDDDDDDDESEDAFDPFSWMNEAAFDEGADGIVRPKKKTQTSKVDIMGEPIGVTPRLTKEFTKIVDLSVEDLKHNFKDGLNEKLQVGAANAAASAVATSDEFAASMHWASYRATLRRHGEYRRCLNTELINPLTKNIASSWAKIFEADLFASLEARAIRHITKLVQDVENSSAAGLKDRARQQGEVALEEAKVAIKSLVTVVRKILNDQQKDISRCLVPHVQSQLSSGYDDAMEERGKGSVARQKAVFHRFIEAERDEVFNGGAETLIERLSAAAESVGAALDDALVDLSQKVEVSLSVLWESPRDDPRQVKARREAVDVLQTVDAQVDLWTDAERKARVST